MHISTGLATVHSIFIKEDSRKVVKEGCYGVIWPLCHHEAALDILQKNQENCLSAGLLCMHLIMCQMETRSISLIRST